jgi:hypothetical protein
MGKKLDRTREYLIELIRTREEAEGEPTKEYDKGFTKGVTQGLRFAVYALENNRG